MPRYISFDAGYVLSKKEMILVVQQLNCAFYGKSMTFCTAILDTKKIILRPGPILKVTCGDLGDHFELCPLWNFFFIYIAVVVWPSIA